MVSLIWGSTMLNCFFAWATFSVRFVDDDFNNRDEMNQMCGLRILFSSCFVLSLLYFTHSHFVIYGGFLYFEILLNLASLYITGWEPVKLSYLPNTIIPFPLNETTISTVELAVQ